MSIGRRQIERALGDAIRTGPKTIPNQIRYILALCLVDGRRTKRSASPLPPYSTAEARLIALTQSADALDPEAIRHIYEEVGQLKRTELRLQLTLGLLPYLPQGIDAQSLYQIIGEIRKVSPGRLRASLLRQAVPLLPRATQQSDELAGPLSSALRAARNISHSASRMRSLVALAPFLPPRGTANLVRLMLEEIESSRDDRLKAHTIVALQPLLKPSNIALAERCAAQIQNPVERVRALMTLLPYQESHHAIMDAIEAISNDEERGDALATFAQRLPPQAHTGDLPLILQRSLGVMIGLNRDMVRARAFVALAHHLTEDLQGEALAMVHNLDDESHRATLLGELAPALRPNMLVAALAVAHTMREADARAYALSALAHYAPEQARHQTLIDALAAAANLPRRYERVMALMRLVDSLPPSLADETYTNALETTRQIENASACARALSLLGQHLPGDMLENALSIAHEVNNHEHRLSALVALSPRLGGPALRDTVQEMLACAEAMPFDYKRARALVSIAPYLEASDIDRACNLLDSIDEPFDRATATLALAGAPVYPEKTQAIEQTLALLPAIDESYDRASIIAALSTAIPVEHLAGLAKQAAETIMTINDPYDKASAIALLAPILTHGTQVEMVELPTQAHLLTESISTALTLRDQTARSAELAAAVSLWLTLDRAAMYQLWVDVIEPLTHLSLADALLVLAEFLPVFERLAGQKTIPHIAHLLGLR
jgi:hypothetical protein